MSLKLTPKPTASFLEDALLKRNLYLVIAMRKMNILSILRVFFLVLLTYLGC